MNVSQILDCGASSVEGKWNKCFMNWREDFFVSGIDLNNDDKGKFKEENLFARDKIEEGKLSLVEKTGKAVPYKDRRDVSWQVYGTSYPQKESIPFQQRYSIRIIFDITPKGFRCLFLDIEDHKSAFTDFFLSVANLERTGQECPICGKPTCSVRVETNPRIPDKAFLVAHCNNPQCEEKGKTISELDYREELEKECIRRVEKKKKAK